jgi:PAS domain S-box-containing protein
VRVALEDARAEAAALAAERDAGHVELLRRTSQLREVEARLRAREEAVATAQLVIRPALLRPALAGDNPEAEAETLRSALEEVQVLAEELGEANAALQRSNDALDRKVAERTAALAEANALLALAEERQRLILESATDHAIFAINPSGHVTSWNAGARNLLGWDAEEAIGLDAAEIFTPEDRANQAPAREMLEARTSGRALDERWHLRRDGSRFWSEGLLLPLRGGAPGSNGDGAKAGFLKILRDRTERRHAEERQALLLAELNHRVKNTLALVLAIVDQTWRAAGGDEGADPADGDDRRFHQGLRARLRALARAHDLLFRDDWAGASLADVVAAAAAAHGGVSSGIGGAAAAPAIRASGPAVRLAPEAAVALAMAFHELATNAAKYGALSVPGGRVEVAWGPTPDGGTLEITWTEEGGPPIVSPPRRRGFGSGLLERGLARQLSGEVTIQFPREGLRCRTRLPFSDRVALR